MFEINGKKYNVPIESIKRTYSKEYKYQVTTEDGSKHSEVRAIYVNYTMNIGCLDDNSYYELINDISIPISSFSVKIPYNGEYINIDCDIKLNGDSILVDDGTNRLWDGMSISFISNTPLGG